MEHDCLPVLCGSLLVLIGRALSRVSESGWVPWPWTLTAEVLLAVVPSLLALHGPGLVGWAWFGTGVICLGVAVTVRIHRARWQERAMNARPHAFDSVVPVDKAIAKVRSTLTARAATDPQFAEACRAAGVDV